jgi:ADP-heptose:LPS heptosyltransferase
MHGILVLRALKVGDFLTGVPAYRAIRRAFPASRIVLAAPLELAPLLDLLPGTFDAVSHARELQPLSPEAHGANLGIDLHGKGPESHRLLLDTHVRELIAFAHPAVPASAGGARFDPAEHEVKRWCRLLSHAGIPSDPADLDLPAPDLIEKHLAHGATLLHSGAASEARRWPVERWIEVARAERSAGRRVILTGSSAEAGRAFEIARGAGIRGCDVFAGRTGLLQLAALVAGSERVVCGDTGIAHLATAFRRPSVVLFGPTAPSLWGPPPRPYHRVLWSGRTGDPHGERIDAGLLEISAMRVIETLSELAA